MRPLQHRHRPASQSWRLRLDRFMLRICLGAVASTVDHAIARRRRQTTVRLGHSNTGRAR